MKNIILLSILFLSMTNLIAQNNPVPEYLMNQKFPDSVLSLKIQKKDGTETTFSDVLKKHKGKKIVIDFWASWCPDCIKGLPKLKSLQKKTKKENIDYVFLSLDKNVPRWNNAIAKFKIKGDHYRIPIGWKNPLTNYIDLDWIPRYVVIDEEGKVIIPKAIKANDAAIEKFLIK